MKDKKDVISEFNAVVNMSADELESWLKCDDSNSAGRPKDGGDGGGESVGHDSGRKIAEILKANPDKKPHQYTEEHVEHMRKVVSYCKRHLAQEKGANGQKSPEEVKKTKSYASLKNWGHDLLLARGNRDAGSGKQQNKKSSGKKGGDDADGRGDDQQVGVEDVVEEADEEDEYEPAEEKDEAEQEEGREEGGENEEDQGDHEEKTGEKRKTRSNQSGPQKKRETPKGRSARKGRSSGDKEDQQDDGDEDGAWDEDPEEEGGDSDEDKGRVNGRKGSKSGKSSKNGPSKGDKVSWNWGGGQPEGKVLDVKEERTTITTKRGNQVSRAGHPEDPAVVLDTGKSKAIKSAHELN